MDTWKIFGEALLPKKKDFYSSINIENITSVDYRHVNRVFKNLNNKNVDDYYGLYVRSDTLLLADVNALKYMRLILLIFCLHLD